MEEIMCSELPIDVLELIIGRLANLKDQFHFSRVCTTWNDAAATAISRLQRPFLMLPGGVRSTEKTRCFFSIDEGVECHVPFSKMARRSWCRGSSHDGWMIMAHRTRGNFLYSPITGARVNLPNHKERIWHYRTSMCFVDIKDGPGSPFYIKKAISVSTSTGILVAAIYDCESDLGFCRPGDQDWIVLTPDIDRKWHIEDQKLGIGRGKPVINDDPAREEYLRKMTYEEFLDNLYASEDWDDVEELRDRENPHQFSDITYYRGMFYAITFEGEVCEIGMGFDSTGNLVANPTMVRTIPLILKGKDLYRVQGKSWNQNYLVVSCISGKLMRIVRLRQMFYGLQCEGWFETRNFFVFELVLSDAHNDSDTVPPLYRWVRVENLGDEVLFLGRNHSKSISVAETGGRFNRNCIYYSDDGRDQRNHFKAYKNADMYYTDMGVFHLEDSHIDKFFCDNYASYLRSLFGTSPSPLYSSPAIFVTPSVPIHIDNSEGG